MGKKSVQTVPSSAGKGWNNKVGGNVVSHAGRGVAETLHYRPTVETVFEFFLSQRCRIEGLDASFHGTFGQLVDWCIASGLIDPAQKGWWEALQDQRNRLAHGGTLVVTPNLPLAYVRETIWKINELFPDPETTEHDKCVKAKPRPVMEIYKYG